MVKRLPAGDPGSIPELGRSPGEGNGKPTPVLLPGESHGRKSMVGYSPWGRKESDTTERLHFTSLEKDFTQSSLQTSWCRDTNLDQVSIHGPPMVEGSGSCRTDTVRGAHVCG